MSEPKYTDADRYAIDRLLADCEREVRPHRTLEQDVREHLGNPPTAWGLLADSERRNDILADCAMRWSAEAERWKRKHRSMSIFAGVCMVIAGCLIWWVVVR